MDFPLINKGEKVRVWFDGWLTIVFQWLTDVSMELWRNHCCQRKFH